MTPERWQQIEGLYHTALERPPDDRAAYLDAACHDDAALREELNSLLELDDDADRFLERTALETTAKTLTTQELAPLRVPHVAGYRVIRELGEGGMGVVYLAEQETPLRRLVALKLIRPGMDSQQVVARFETERQALAMMEHPNIAAVFDAGSTDDGRLYFVMEFVDGAPITEYCDRVRLSTRARLELFLRVCAAVQHAHQKGVIHRDIKPSNILVSEQDDVAVPKVIDFGTAKAIEAGPNLRLTLGQGQVLGTPEYMSPEQAAFSSNIDTATDVYSLGVVLYELLVGQLPFVRPSPDATGFDELRRAIRELDPPRPSSRIAKENGTVGPNARARRTDAGLLARELSGDLDWIVLKALEKDRARRYATVAAFATDVGRFLHDQPVEARPPSAAYRMRKFARRYRAAVAVAAAMLGILIAGLVLITYLYRQEEQSRQVAERRGLETEEQRQAALEQGRKANLATADANAQRLAAVASQADTEAQRQVAMGYAKVAQDALKEAAYGMYVSTIAAADGDLRSGAPAQARARLLALPTTQLEWEWHHLFLQTDASLLTLHSQTPPCELPFLSSATPLLTRQVLRVSDSLHAVLLRRCAGLDVWDDATYAHTTRRGPEGSPLVLAVSDAGQMLALSRTLLQLELTERASATVVATLGPFDSTPRCADISADGNWAAVGLPPGLPSGRDFDVFEVWNLATHERALRLVPTQPAVRDTRQVPQSCLVSFSQDGTRIATSGATVHVYDTSSGREVAADQQPARLYSQAIAFSPNGQRLAIGRSTGLVDLLELARSPVALTRLDGGDLMAASTAFEQILSLAFLPDGEKLVSGAGATIGIWDVGQSRLTRILSGHAADVIGVAVSRDGRAIYSADTSGTVRSWSSDASMGVTRISGLAVNTQPLAASAGGNTIATTAANDELRTLRVTDMRTELVREGSQAASGRSPITTSLALSPDGAWLFSAERGAPGWIRRWAVGSKHGAPEASDATTTAPCGNPLTSTGDTPSNLVVGPDGRQLAFSQIRCVVVRDAVTLKQVTTLEVPGYVSSLLFRPDGTLLVASRSPLFDSGASVSIWDWRAGKLLATVHPVAEVGSQNQDWRLASSADGRRIAMVSYARGTPSTVLVWDGKLQGQLGRLPSGDFAAVALSADGRRLVSVGRADPTVRIWDADRFLPLLTLVDTDSHLGGVTFTAQGQVVAARTSGGLTIWDSRRPCPGCPVSK